MAKAPRSQQPSAVPRSEVNTNAINGLIAKLNNATSAAQRASERLREDTRFANEATQAMVAQQRALANALTEAQRFIDGLVANEVEKKAPELVKPQLEAAIQATVKQFQEMATDAATAYRGGLQDALDNPMSGDNDLLDLIRGPSKDLIKGPSQDERCPHCGACGDIARLKGGIDYQPLGKTPASAKPIKGSISVCAECGKLAIFDYSPMGGKLILRKLTDKEQKAVDRSRAIQHLGKNE